MILVALVCALLCTSLAAQEGTKMSLNDTNVAASLSTTEMSITGNGGNSSVDSCSDLGENCTVTKVTGTTAATPTASAVNKDDNSMKRKTPQLRKTFKVSKRESCSCDLRASFCDVNCCCDQDCSPENKQAFSDCSEETELIRDTRFCDYVDYIYKNNTLYEWDVNQNGLFCIAKYNLPKIHVVQKKQEIKSANEANLQKRTKYTWPSLVLVKEVASFNGAEEFRHGSRIWMFSNVTKSLSHFQLPNHVATQTCLSKKDILFLTEFSTTCHVNYVEEEDVSLSAETYFKNLTVISAPKLFNTTLYTNRNLECPKNVCVPLEPQICDEHFQNCVNLSKIDKSIKPTCKVAVYNDEVYCINLVGKVKYLFYHNGTGGFRQIIVKIHLSTFAQRLSEEATDFLQEFSVNFLWTNQSLTYSSRRSGNPGYQQGAPILAANLLINETLVNSTTGNGTETLVWKNVTRNPHDFADNFLTLPASKLGICVLDNYTNNVVEFSVDSVQKCAFRTLKPFNNSKTANETCRSIQRAIFDLWFVSTKNTTLKMIGNFGNANEKNLGDWSPIIFEVNPENFLANVTGNYSVNNTLVTCGNLTTNLRIDVFHARVVQKGLDHQEKIIGTVYELIRNVDSSVFQIGNGNIAVDARLRHEVMFFDVTLGKVKKFADPPLFHLKLPYDFFYPFVRLSNGSQTLGINAFLINVVISLIVLIHLR